MPTDAELKLQAKYEALRKAKEAKALKKKQAEAAAAAPVHSQQQQQQSAQAQPQQQSQLKRFSDQPRRQSATQNNSANKSKLAAGSPSIKLKLSSKSVAAASKKQARLSAAAAAAPAAPTETPRDKALRLLKEQREKRNQVTALAKAAEAELAAEAALAEKPFVIPKRQPTRQPEPEDGEHRDPALLRPTQDDAAAQPQQLPKRSALKRPAAKPRPASGSSAVTAPPPKRKAAPVFAAQDTKRPRSDEQESRRAAAIMNLAPAPEAQPACRVRTSGWGYAGGVRVERGTLHRAHRDAADEARAATLFVGDLPHHYDNDEVEQVFNQFAVVIDARVVGTQCYAFVRFNSPESARGVMETASSTPIEVEGRQLRVNWAQGAMASWKQGSKLVPTKEGNSNSIGIESYEHPKVREARAAAQHKADELPAAELVSLELRPPPARTLVAYDDL